MTEQVLFQPNNKFAIMPIFIYQRVKDGDSRHGREQSGNYAGWLRKFTIAPQIGAGRKCFSRPVLCAFLTGANWSDGLKSFVSGPRT